MSDAISRLNTTLESRYHVERQLGEGGMATVYLADDLRHGRKVALKVLKPELAAIVGAERFLAEIRTTANLQHPHILPLFDSGAADGFLFYVMPYVAGESLRERLARDRQLAVNDAVRIATQVAEALEYAHQRGVIHRDIKPANILLHDDDAMVADFGIALAVGADRGRMTQTGVSVGTPQYMSPEQATGDSNVGARSDIWSLGCVLYEMLAGEPPYQGATPQAMLGHIVTGNSEPVTKRRRTTPAHVASVVAKALETVPADRFESAREFARSLNDPRFRHGEPRMARKWMVVAAGAGLYAIGFLTWWIIGLAGADRSTAPIHFSIPGITASSVSRTLAISPDGTLLADAAPGRGLWLRRVGDSAAPRDLSQPSAIQPTFSPDGAHIAYFDGIAQSLMRMPTAGGTPTMVVAGNGARGLGATWGEDGTIVFATTSGVYRVSPDEGTPAELLLAPDHERGVFAYSWPQWLPGKRAVLLTVVPRTATTDSDCSIAVLDLEGRELTEVLSGGSGARYVPSGHLLFSADGGTLHGVAFDPSKKRIRGERIVLPIEGLSLARVWGADFDLSAGGTLVYAVATQQLARLVWVGRDGREEPLAAPPRDYIYPRVSPDGSRIAVDIGPQGARNIVVWDINRSTLVPIANEPAEEWAVEWSPRGDSLYYTSNQAGGTFLVYRRAADGSGEAELIFSHDAFEVPQDVTADGVRIIVIESRPSPTDQFDIMALTLGDPVRRDTVLSTPGFEYNASLSPDGRFIAYQTYEAGQSEIYVRPMNGSLRQRTKVSIDGGEKPLWSPIGDTIFYRSKADSMMAARVETQSNFRVQDVSALFAMGYGSGFGAVSGRSWDVSPADGRFVMVKRPRTSGPSGVRVVLNWTPEFRRLMRQ